MTKCGCPLLPAIYCWSGSFWFWGQVPAKETVVHGVKSFGEIAIDKVQIHLIIYECCNPLLQYKIFGETERFGMNICCSGWIIECLREYSAIGNSPENYHAKQQIHYNHWWCFSHLLSSHQRTSAFIKSSSKTLTGVEPYEITHWCLKNPIQ